ncbi:MAG: hypothetical protein HOJ22_01605 [Chloroflexi bacterium]|nr:hypothetical protein [Chloroflexota bacterium]MBT5626958.1 hypothetical protein [Chloroflexota bacterium]
MSTTSIGAAVGLGVAGTSVGDGVGEGGTAVAVGVGSGVAVGTGVEGTGVYLARLSTQPEARISNKPKINIVEFKRITRTFRNGDRLIIAAII